LENLKCNNCGNTCFSVDHTIIIGDPTTYYVTCENCGETVTDALHEHIYQIEKPFEEEDE